MKVTLDLTDLVQKGQLTQAEADRLAKLGQQDTGALGVNILMAFGAVAVVLGIGILIPNLVVAAALSTVLFIGGLSLVLYEQTRWLVFARICVTIGALGLVAIVTYLSNSDFYVGLVLAVGLALTAYVATSGLLAALSVLELSMVMGAGTAYWHASYAAWVERPAITIGVLAVVALGLFFVSLRVPSAYERVCLIAARTAILMINLAFLIGSLWGDMTLGWPASWFTIAWALLLIGVGLWAITANRRWVVNAAAVFGAIHFYTQWFEYLGASAFSVLGGGLLLIVFGFALLWFNRRLTKAPGAPTPVAA